ncbi:hypothetical protein E3O45_03810 [Cryobacterium sp. TMS1-20-1]|uniref:hypothetical protein n=1 Tax=Cryobacterium sp. TMS1-20-1 TaxID=1259223 RepID=UPI00106B34A4|nr:hypothetical protein [Cryobacterium sp. TMS1-20-1]TFC79413.1 hypothetical protein E3O45_03810 [Cryobacterium sp. TMS1-20-1]
MQTEMSFLIDSNVVIAAEPFNGKLEDLQPVVSSFMRIASEHGHKVYVHPAVLDDLRETSDETHRAQNIAAYTKYPSLTELPVPPEVWDVFPDFPNPNDKRDARILTALHKGAVHFLVTNDRKLRSRAIRLGHELTVLRPGEAAGQLAAWHPDAPPPPPMVEEVKTYTLDESQAIFESLRVAYYPAFDKWIAKVRRESADRRAWIIRDTSGTYEALAVVKMRDQHPVHTDQDAIKLSTFKVGDAVSGRRLGELLLKAVLRWAANEPGRPSDLFVEVSATQERLIEFLIDFGFGYVTSKPGQPDEHVYLKILDPPASSDLDGLAHHIAYGPPAVRAGQPIFVIPITPGWYEDLFPDATVVGTSGSMMLDDTFTTPKAHGNAIRKAYLCHSPTKDVPPGSTLLFYRSQGKLKADGAVVAVGVAERSLRSEDPVETIELSFKRTVYSSNEVAALHENNKAVLSVLFRHDRFVVPPWSLGDLVSNSVINTWPQSIVRVRSEEGRAWIENQLDG